jgi:hypothetical protein
VAFWILAALKWTPSPQSVSRHTELSQLVHILFHGRNCFWGYLNKTGRIFVSVDAGLRE